MADTKISGASANTSPAATDMVPTAKSGNTGKYYTTLQKIADFVLGLYGYKYVVQQVEATLTTVATGTTTIPYDDTIPQNTEGDEYLTRAITPTNASNNLVIDVEVTASNSIANTIVAALFQDSTASALAAVGEYATTGTGMSNLKFSHRMTAGTTSATTFKLRVGAGGAGTTTVNGVSGARLFGGVMKTLIRITEYKA